MSLTGCTEETDSAAEDIDEVQQGITTAFTSWHWNVAGDTINAGSITNHMVERAVSSILNRDADFATFNEICRTQYDAIRDALLDEDWPIAPSAFSYFHATLQAQPSGNPHCGEIGGEMGNAIFSRLPLASNVFAIYLPFDGEVTWGVNQHRGLACIPLSSSQSFRICVTHTTTHPEDKQSQLNAIRNYLALLGGTWILNGDLNAQPNYTVLNSWYSSTVYSSGNPNNSGLYRELDDTDSNYPEGTGEVTTLASTKLDFMFVRESKIVGAYDMDSLGATWTCGPAQNQLCSDHRATVGHVTLSY